MTAQLAMGVRLLQVQAHMCVHVPCFFSLFGLIYRLLGMGKIFTCATLVSFKKKFLVMYER